MIQGLKIAVQGMTPLIQKQDQIANNLANTNSTAFKQSNLFTRSYQKFVENDQLQPYANREIKADEVYIDWTQGASRSTGNALDVLIDGDGFLTVMTGEGTRYTRNGSLELDREGYLVTHSGDRVMGKEGYIKIDGDERKQVTITGQGEIFQGDVSRGLLDVVDFPKPYRLSREGQSLYRPLEPSNTPIAARNFSIKQGFLEGSNVNPVKNMVDMISSLRTYEASQRAVLAQNETLDKAVNTVGRVS